MAIIITSLSYIGQRNDNIEDYSCLQSNDNKRNVKGIYTNCAPLRFLIEEAAEKSNNTDNILVLAIVTKEVFTNKVLGNDFNKPDSDKSLEKTTYQFYEELINQYKKRYNYDIKIEPVFYGFDNTMVFDELFKKGERASAMDLFKDISQKSVGHESVYIDFTGGGREVSYLMTSIIRYLSTFNFNVEDIVYSNKRNNANQILKIKYIYKLEAITTAVNDFIETGSVSQLKKFFEKEKKNCRTVPNPYEKICNLINCLEQMAHVVAVCAVDGLSELQHNIIDKLNDVAAIPNSNEIYVEAFKLLIPEIKKSLFIGEQNSTFGTCEMIKWCISHRFTMQAVDIFIEKMPDEFIEMGIGDLIKPEDQGEDFYSLNIDTNERHFGKSENAIYFYEKLYDAILPQNRFSSKFSPISKEEAEDAYISRFKVIEQSGLFSKAEKDRIEELRVHIENYIYDENNKNKSMYGCHYEQRTKNDRLNSMAKKFSVMGNVFEGEKNGCSCKTPTYTKKQNAVKFVMDAGDDYSKLASLMNYYLALKILRNCMCHSSTFNESGENSDEQAKIEVYSECIKNMGFEDIIKDNSYGYTAVKTILKAALDYFESIPKKEKLITQDSWKELFNPKAL